jgi:outer membrane protein, heavy metal efflux system
MGIGEGQSMRIHVLTFLLSAALTTTRAVNAAPAESERIDPAKSPLSLADALRRFETDNLDLVAAKYEVSVARANTIATGVWPNPTLGLGGAFLVHGAQTGGEQEFSVSLAQAIPFAGQIGSRQEVAEAYATASEREFASAVWQLASEVKLAYLELQLREATLKAEENALTDMARIEQIVEVRTQAGAGSSYDKLRIQVERARGLSRLGDANARLAEAKTALASKLGKSTDALSLQTSGDVPEPAATILAFAPLLERALTRRPERAAMQAREDAAQRNTTAVRRNVIPVPVLSLGYNHALRVQDDLGKRSGGMLLAQLSIPLPLLDRGQGSIARNEAFFSAEHARSEAVDLSIKREVERTYQVAIARREGWSKFKNLASTELEKMRQIAELSYREGRATVLELLDAYAAHRDLRLEALSLKTAALKAEIELERAVGPESRTSLR